MAQNKIQEIPNHTRKFQEEENQFTPNCGNPPMIQQPNATAAATSTAPLTRDDIPWPTTMSASTNLFVPRASWPILPNVNEVLTPAFVKTEKLEEKAQPKQAAIPHALILNKSQNSKSAEEECRWGTQCPFCVQSNPNIKAEDSKDDWDGERQRNRKEDQLEGNYYPSSPKYFSLYDFPDRLLQDGHYKMEKDRNERLEFLNNKYNLDYYSDSNSDSDSEHKYKALV